MIDVEDGSDLMIEWPPPCDLGLPARYTAWRPGQAEAVAHVLESDKRFIGLVLPTGAGKSLIGMAVQVMGGERGLSTTMTRALQDQLHDDFGEMPSTAVMKGQRAYLCQAVQPGGELSREFGSPRERPTVDQGPCHLGVECSKKTNGCGYFDALRRTFRADRVITNYAWWLTLRNNPLVAPLVRPDVLILDEAHAAPDALADALGATVTARDVKDIFGDSLPQAETQEPADWVAWAARRAAVLEKRLENTYPNNGEAAKRLRRMQWLHRALARVAAIDPTLLLASDEMDDGPAVKFDVVWAAPFAEDCLFRGVKRVVLMSATFTKHTAELLGIAPKDLDFYEQDSTFPKERRPVYYVETVRVDKDTSEGNLRVWLAAVDRIIDERQDRKGLIHSKSYARRDYILTHSRHRERMVTHGRHDAADRVRAFRQLAAGHVLVSPAMTTGYDFPYTDAEYQILAKIPFPDSRDPVIKARTLIDREYPAHVAMQEIVQATGRIMRAEDDRGETFILDDHAKWFFSKHANLAPKWFRRAYARVVFVPDPPPPLALTHVHSAVHPGD